MSRASGAGRRLSLQLIGCTGSRRTQKLPLAPKSTNQVAFLHSGNYRAEREPPAVGFADSFFGTSLIKAGLPGTEITLQTQRICPLALRDG